jgi:hypothetical protein
MLAPCTPKIHYVDPADDPRSIINIDPEFRSQIPAISDHEREQLEANIVEHGGARDPLTVWPRGDDDMVLLDGHNRYEVCTRLRLPFAYCEVEVATRDQAADWIDRNQLGRRNLSDEGRKILLGRLYNRTKKAEHDGGKGKRRSGGHTDHHSEKTSDRVAREHGVSATTVRRAGKYQAAAAELGIEQEIVAGEIKATEAQIVEAAATLPDNPSSDDVAQARERVKVAGGKRRRGKPPAKPTAGESRRNNGRIAERITRSVLSLRGAVETLGATDSAYREQAIAELQRCVERLSRSQPASPAKPAKRQPDDELRTAVAQRWEAMRLWAQHWALADMKDVRRMFLEVIREEQKQIDK